MITDNSKPRTIVVRYEHEIDALDRVASVLRRQRVRAEAFTAVASHDRATVQATIMFDSSDKTAARIVSLLGKQVGVLAVEAVRVPLGHAEAHPLEFLRDNLAGFGIRTGQTHYKCTEHSCIEFALHGSHRLFRNTGNLLNDE